MGNNLLSAGSTAIGIVLAVLILLAMITIHEFGHYVAGKILKFKINEFSVGFGPAIFKRRSKKTGELFAVRLIPLGGYCAFEGEDGLDEEKENGPTMSEGEPFEETSEAPMSESKQFEGASDTSMPEATEKPVVLSDGAFTKKKPWQRIIVLVAGAFMNYVLALLLIFAMFGGYGQSLIKVRGVDIYDSYEREEGQEVDGFPAEYSFREGDILLQAAGKNLYLTTDVAQALNGKKAGDIVTFRVARLTEDGSRSEVTQEIMLRSDVVVKNSTQVSGVWKAIGIGVETLEDGSYYMISSASYRFGFWETIGRSFAYSFKIAGSIFRVLGELLTGKLGLDAFGGPITTITMTSEIASTSFRNFLEISAYIGVNLAVFNLLPIPALDGSKVVFTAIEWVRGKPISRRVEAVIHTVGFVLLLGFAILVDILQFI